MNPLDGMDLSAAQVAAVTDPASEVLVAAGAGSGKTRLLVAAVVRALVEERLPAERLIAVTFTRKAAAELASRVRDALDACGRLDLARGLDSAVLGTIDALCLRLVRDNALKAGVDPNCAVLEPEAAEMVKDEAVRQAWETVVGGAGGSMLGALASQGQDLCEEVVALYDRLRSLGHDDPRISVVGGEDEHEARSRLVETVEQALAAAAAHARRSPSVEADLDKLRDCLTWLQGPAEARSGESGLAASKDLFPSRKTRALEDFFAPVRAALARYRCALAETVLRPLAEAVNALLAEFHRVYSERKLEGGLVDFADVELKARALLALGAGTPDQAGLFAGSLLLVDEFQDTNELQCSILGGLGAARVLMVGDERQSIYRFRGAEVEVFRRRRTELATGRSQGCAGGLHRLDANYRSDPALLDFINRLFSHEDFFGDGFPPLAAHPARKPVEPRPDAAVTAAHPRVEVLLAERRYEGEDDRHMIPRQQAEAEALAAHVRALVDREEWRQRDIVVLLPTQTQVGLYRDALLASRLDVYLVRGKGYYAQEEVTDVIALLRLLVNPNDDFALISVLRSPLTGLSDDGLYTLGRERKRRHARSLWEVTRSDEVECLGDSDGRALACLLERLDDLRSRVGRPGLSRLIDDAVSVFGYDVCLLGAPDGRRRFANVRKLMRLAEEFERINGPDLKGLTAVLDSRGRLSDREGSAPTLTEGEDVVRVMTVHQAKGLEFPVVALAGLGADFHRPEARTLMVDGDGRAGIFLKGHWNRTYEEHHPCWGPAAEIAAKEWEKEREEDVRLLYVAMTRAQERLVLVGSRPQNDSTEGSRIGRILAALGLTTPPTTGEMLLIPGLSAVVAAVDPVPAPRLVYVGSPSAWRPHTDRADRDGVKGSPEAEAPRFLEPPAGGGAPRRVSYSALAAYELCPRRYYLERVLGLAFEPHMPGAVSQADAEDEGRPDGVLDDDERGGGLDVGILVHRLLEVWPLEEGRPPTETARAAAREVALAEGMRLSLDGLERAVKLTLAVWDSPFTEVLSGSPKLKEAPFFFAQGDTLVSGVMDLVIQGADCWQVVDYKTNTLKDRTVKELGEAYSLQGQVYCLAALRAGAPAVRLDFLFLERPTEPVTMLYEAGDTTRLEERLNDVLAGLRKGDFKARAGDACGRCQVASVCRGMAQV